MDYSDVKPAQQKNNKKKYMFKIFRWHVRSYAQQRTLHPFVMKPNSGRQSTSTHTPYYILYFWMYGTFSLCSHHFSFILEFS